MGILRGWMMKITKLIAALRVSRRLVTNPLFRLSLIESRVLGLTILTLTTSPTTLHAKTGRCVLEVQHKTYLNGPCEITINDKLGSFAIGVSDTHRSKHFAYVNVENGQANGYWNQNPSDNHAADPLGVLKRDGACWKNETALVCAYN